jgi:hypothetical protein
MATPSTNVSVTIPVTQAIDRVKRLLFRPFDLGKWFTIGFCAWLAHLGEAGFNMNYRYGPQRGGDFRHEWERAREYVMDNLYWILPLAVGLAFISLVFWVAFKWLSSRGKFMFLHCVALERAEVSVPWHKFARAGNSLFGFRLVLGLIGMLAMLPGIVIVVLIIIRMLNCGPDVGSILALVGFVMLLVTIGMVFFVIAKLTTDFVVPIMSLRAGKCLAAWRELLGLISANFAQFLLYLLFQVVLGMAIGVLVLIVILATCCCAGCLLIIPYLGTVLLLPVLAFGRAYSLHYLAQYGPQYDVFPPPTTTA